MGWGRRIGLFAGGLLLLALLALASVILADRAAQPGPPDARILIARAARHHARIRRDSWGVPHILG
ncbi:MAG: hypothetical protein JO303_13410, partial [Caulobacteraceae bacterium]|nr:hypothetical protein [Caulobacteraceae bacterium]